jgi:hypothetical protein
VSFELKNAGASMEVLREIGIKMKVVYRDISNFINITERSSSYELVLKAPFGR